MNDETGSEEVKTAPPTAIVTTNPSRILPVPRLTTIIAVGFIGFLLFALASRMAMRFYASALFSFYGLTALMWVSVMLLGVFQTILMVPLRVINLIKSQNLREFQQKIADIKSEQEQQFVLKKSVKGGERVILFYVVNFVIQAVSYLTIGRLFLTDFYNYKLDPALLYRFVPYPNYPIQGLIYKLPYVWFTDTYDFGLKAVFWVWLVIGAIQALIYLWKYLRSRQKAKDNPNEPGIVRRARKYSTGYLVVGLILSYLIVRHFPVGWEIFYFTGDVSKPNPQFNLITAIVTFFTIVWLSLSKIRQKGELAEKAGMDHEVIAETQRGMLKDTLLSAAFIGTGAYFITNRIPSAFELSIFTFEVIALLSPWTLDKIVLSRQKMKQEREEEAKREREIEIEKEKNQSAASN